MTKKNWALAAILFILIVVFGFMIGQKGPAGNVQIARDLFSVADTASIEKITLRQPGGLVQTLEKRNGYWLLNGEHAADPAVMRLLLSVLKEAQVRRPVARSQQEEVLEQLDNTGVLVEIEGANPARFVAGGREADKISYFALDDEAYVVELPGYSSFVSGIFNLKQSDLRVKQLTSLNSMNFMGLDIDYPADTAQNVSIRFKNNMLGVEEIIRPDSSVLFQYMMIYEPLEVSAYYTPGEDAAYDSLLQTNPQAVFRMRTVGGDAEGLMLQLYPPLPGRNLRLGYLPKQKEAVLLDERLAQAMLLRRLDLLLGE